MSDLNVGKVSANILGTDTVTTKTGTPVMTFDSNGAVSFSSGAGLQLWTDGTRPSNPSVGSYGFNTTTSSFEVFDGSFWLKFEPKSPIVTSGLLVHLDAGDLNSYSGAGSTWTDITGNGYNATIRGTNRFSNTNGGVFDFGVDSQTSDWIEMPRTALNTLGGSYTLETWLAPRTSDGARYWHSMATSGSDNTQIYQQNASTLGPYQGTVSVSYTDGEWMQFVSVRSGTNTGLVYKNAANPYSSGAIQNLTSVEGWVLNQEQDSVLGGFAATQNFWGAFAIVRLYNRALTAAEIKQNYDTQKGRFGLT